MPCDATTQTRNAFAKVQAILDAAGVDVQAVVEITSYHTALPADFDAVDAVFRDVSGVPLPAWTAVEVAGLRRHGAVIEMRIVVHAPARA